MMETNANLLEDALSCAYKKLTGDVAEIFAAAAEAYRKTTQAPDYVAPKQYVTRRPPTTQAVFDAWPPTEKTAHRWNKEYDDYFERNQKAVGLEELHDLWVNFYEGNFKQSNQKMPLAEMHALGLSRLIWHDIMTKAIKIVEQHERLGHVNNRVSPFNLLMDLGQKQAKYAKNLVYRDQRLKRVRAAGELRDQPDDDDLPDAYPRTYL